MPGGTLQQTQYSAPPHPPLPLGSSSYITFVVTMPWALWISYRSESPADMPGGLCPWDGPPKDSPSIHPSIRPQVGVRMSTTDRDKHASSASMATR